MESMIFINTEIGEIGIKEDGSGITSVFFETELPKIDPDTCVKQETPLLRKASHEIIEYLEGKRKEFSVPLSLKGTTFQMEDWKALMTIPYGETRSYQDIAKLIGRPKACRAVGHANNRNPISIIIPCHRVVGKNGSMTGYGGGIPIKEYLLNLESKNK